MNHSGTPAPPYPLSHANAIYQLLFCDDANLFRPQPNVPQPPASWEQILFAARPDPSAIRALAVDPAEESRVRMLASNWLRQNGHAPPAKELLGVILEVGLDAGLDTLAVYADGRIRYINHTSKLSILEAATPEIVAKASEVIAHARHIITRIGPWDKPRLPSPPKGTIRMTFLVTDGLYFGQGPFPGMDRDPLAAPLIHSAGQLLQQIVAVNTKA